MDPLVTVICVSFNHKAFVMEALESVKSQSYQNIEIIIVDDGSTDGSAELIEDWVKANQVAQFLNLKSNQGYCRAFNQTLRFAKGDFIIDFATDDVMPSNKIEEQVSFFLSLPEDYGVVFTDADYIDKDGKYLRSHFPYLLTKGLLKEIPQGNVYHQIISTYFIPSPTMMVRSKVFESLHGYDEELVYEDFDFWVRSSRTYQYAYLPKSLMKIRRNINSMSSGWYKQGDRQLHSTYLVCKKIQQLNQNEAENDALVVRLAYELRQSVFSENIKEAKLFYEMLEQMRRVRLVDRLIFVLGKLRFPLAGLRKLYHSIRYKTFT